MSIIFKVNTRSENAILLYTSEYIPCLKTISIIRSITICIMSAIKLFFIDKYNLPIPCNIPFVTVASEKKTVARLPIFTIVMSVFISLLINNTLHIGSAKINNPTNAGNTISRVYFIEYLVLSTTDFTSRSATEYDKVGMILDVRLFAIATGILKSR